MAVKKVQRCARASSKMSAQQIVKSNERKKQVPSVSKKDRKAIVIAQEIKFARLLSSNDKRVRDKVLKNLRKWLTVRSNSSFAFTESDFLRLWKGLYYCMWMSDKPLIQEELAESLSKIVHCFNDKDVVLLYTTCVLKTLGTEWYGIDQYRLDKFSMLARRIVRQTFQKCKETSWDFEWIKGISEILEKILTDKKTCRGFSMHLTEVFMEELSKISGGDISENVVTELIKPFISYFIVMDDEPRIKHVVKHIFEYLIFQSDTGMDYMERFKAWRDAGFPSGSIDAVEKFEVSDEEVEDGVEEEEEFLQEKMKNDVEKPLDPRAGRVDVELPQIPFNAEEIATLLSQYKFHSSSTAQSRRQIRCLIKAFTDLSQGKMPLGVKELTVPKTQKKDTDTKSAAMRLLNLEQELHSDNVKKKRKRKSNGQLIEDITDKFSDEEDFEDINDGDNVEKVDEIKPARKKKKKQRKVDTNDKEPQTNTDVSDTNVPNSKKKKYKLKDKDRNTSKTYVQNGNCELKKDPLLLVKENIDCKKTKLKRKNTTTADMLNIATPVQRKNTTKFKVCGKWDVSDNVAPSMPISLNNNKKSQKNIEEMATNNTTQKNDIPNEQPMWLVPVLKKLENERSRTPISLKEQYKRNTNLDSKKRVKIALQRNTAQHTSEYILQVRKSPSIPFDANRKPIAGVLKASPIPSPINPFYKKNVK